jgi:tRNA-modifying protein YgfZ
MATQATADLEPQYRAMREGVVLVDGAGAVLRVTGADAVDFLQGQITNDVAALEPGRGCYALLLNPKGRILADMRVLMLGREELLLDSEQADKLKPTLSMYTIGRDAQVGDAEMAVRSLLGPDAASALGLDPPADEHASVRGRLAEADAIAVRTAAGIDVLFPSSQAAAVDELLAERVSQRATAELAEIARIESGRPRYGVDMGEQNLPGELGLEQRAVSFTKGCYVGQEPVARMYHRGHPNRHLRGLRLPAPVSPGTELSRDGKQVGQVTSACVSPDLGPIALALVRREVEPGAVVEVSPGDAPATVSELPFERDG